MRGVCTRFYTEAGKLGAEGGWSGMDGKGRNLWQQVYGFAKILKTQFAVSYLRNDTPAGQLNGFELTWNYFGHSYWLAVIIASSAL
jgi:hypothetical protein